MEKNNPLVSFTYLHGEANSILITYSENQNENYMVSSYGLLQ